MNIPRFVFVGSESVGKTTLINKLSEYYKTNFVTEYGREYTELRIAEGQQTLLENENTNTDETKVSNVLKSEQTIDNCISVEWCTKDFIHIAEQQNINENKCALESNRFLLCDTDSFATYIWHEHYIGTIEPQILTIFDELRTTTDFSKRHYFLLESAGVPFVQDGSRDGEHHRDWMFNRFVDELTAHNLPFTLLGGGYADREQKAIAEIDKLMSGNSTE